jgi:osmotically inducible protein OsmC
MAATRRASAVWNGTLFEGSGRVTFESSGLGTHDVTWAARTEEPGGMTSPEELIAAAQASCYCMALSNVLAKAGTPATQLDVSTEADFVPGQGITQIRLTVRGDVPGVDADRFRELAEEGKANCPVSNALQAVPITLTVVE